MKYPISLSLFFPTYNEEENIQELIESTVRVVEDSPYIGEYEVLIINDGSKDRTQQAAEALAEQYPYVHVINHPKNLGYGAALKTGIKAATKDYVFFTDADLQFDIVELQNLIVQVADHEDMVVGYRAPRRDPFMRLMNAKAWNALNRFLFGLRIRDIDCAFKLFKRELVQDLPLRSNGAMINAEILIRLQRAGTEIKEVPVSHLPRVAGSPTGAKPSVILRAFREMVNLYRGELGLVTHKQAMKFLAVGVINTTIDISVYFLLTRSGALPESMFVTAKFFSFMTGTVSSLILNRYWTFEMRSRITMVELARFYAMISVSLAVNLTTIYVAVQTLQLPDVVGLFFATGFSFIASYSLSKLWVFRPEPSQGLTPAYR
ncbi:MAG: glycosyl transferase family 2 [Parcubacteria group bacterium]|nr:glycosyl transferase family 2 [Parcubacteria group bacterium]